MEGFTKRKWIAITLAAVVLPLSLLTMFKLTGIMPEPMVAETFAVEAKSWVIERTSRVYTYTAASVFGPFESLYSDGTASVGLRVCAGTYHAEDGWAWTLYNYLNFYITGFANVSDYFIHSMTVEFSRGNNDTSAVRISTDDDLLFLYNLTIHELNYFGYEDDAYIMAMGKNMPRNCGLVDNMDWVFLDTSVDDSLEVRLKTIYFNGTAYKQIVIPIDITILVDAGNTFETARTITAGRYYGYVNCVLDLDDYYAVFLNAGQTISVRAIPDSLVSIGLCLYDQNKNLLANLTSTELGRIEEASFTAESSGKYFVHIVPTGRGSTGLYELTIMTSYK